MDPPAKRPRTDDAGHAGADTHGAGAADGEAPPPVPAPPAPPATPAGVVALAAELSARSGYVSDIARLAGVARGTWWDRGLLEPLVAAEAAAAAAAEAAGEAEAEEAEAAAAEAAAEAAADATVDAAADVAVDAAVDAAAAADSFRCLISPSRSG